MNDALIGHSGFVGSTLLRQRTFQHLFRSTNIEETRDRQFDLVVCAGAPAQKWIANREPEADKANILRLIESLDKLNCERFVLISTVDVFANPCGVDENTLPDENGLRAYGSHRLLLERFIEKKFPDSLIVRLPGLVGPGLRKNVIFDLHNDNNLSTVESRNIFQFYPIVNLWTDIQVALMSDINLLHLTAAPISVAQVASEGFGRNLDQHLAEHPVQYDFRSCHSALFGIDGPYQYSMRDTLLAIRAYAQSAPRKLDS
jgi:hypothetical protein